MKKSEKKVTTKLELSKETLRALERDQLQEAMGGIVSYGACRTLGRTGELTC